MTIYYSVLYCVSITYTPLKMVILAMIKWSFLPYFNQVIKVNNLHRMGVLYKYIVLYSEVISFYFSAFVSYVIIINDGG